MRYDLIVLGDSFEARSAAISAARRNQLVAVVRNAVIEDWSDALRLVLAEEGIDDVTGELERWSEDTIAVRSHTGEELTLSADRILLTESACVSVR